MIDKNCKNCQKVFITKCKIRIFCAKYCAQEFHRNKRKSIPETFGKCSYCSEQATSFFQCKAYCIEHYKLKKEDRDVKI